MGHIFPSGNRLRSPLLHARRLPGRFADLLTDSEWPEHTKKKPKNLTIESNFAADRELAAVLRLALRAHESSYAAIH